MFAPPKWNGPSKALSDFRNCFEAGMSFEEALGCAGLSGKSEDVIRALRNWWDTLTYRAVFG